jgi:hypothetical protein
MLKPLNNYNINHYLYQKMAKHAFSEKENIDTLIIKTPKSLEKK